MPGRDSEAAVALTQSGLLLDGETVPLWAAAVHYWRLERSAWRPALEATRAIGFRLVDIYVPWSVHETASGEHDFGLGDSRRDVATFVRSCDELGLKVILRPGPHINAELTGFGIPERVLWDPACQARSPRGNPVVLPAPPLAFPVPSYASEAFLREVEHWFESVGQQLAELVYPRGPIVLVQVDNEGAMYFRDGVFDQDYHPDAVARYRRYLRQSYGTVKALQDAYGDPDATFARSDPPTAFSAHTPRELARHLDWADLQEQLLADSFAHMRAALERSGFTGVPYSHNLPLSEGVTPLDPARLGQVVELLGLDYYHGASAPSRREIARRTTELAERARAGNFPPFACELGAGFPPFFPPLTDTDNFFTALCALAYGLRGLNAYMLVERDRWIGAPVTSRGKRRPNSERWQRLLSALERTRFHELERHAAVHVVVPRSLRRLARVTHAFGPLSAAVFQVLGAGAPEACFEDDFGLGEAPAIAAERFVRQLESALERERIPVAFASGDLLERSLERAAWTIVVSSGALEPELVQLVDDAFRAGRAVSVGPLLPERDHRMLPLTTRLGWDRPGAPVPGLLSLDHTALDRTVASAALTLALPRLAVTPKPISATLHRRSDGSAAVLFLVNPSEHPLEATVTAAGAKEASDALTGERFASSLGALHVPIAARTVRMLELSGKA